MRAAFPDGISETHLDEPPQRRVRASWIGLLVLGAILGGSLFGIFGGHSNEQLSQTANGAELTLSAPGTLRNGEFFELTMEVVATRAIAQPILAVSASSVRNLTINTVWPEPAGQKFADGAFLFEYDPLQPGDTLLVKIDGQSNPTLFGGTQGRLEVRDGDTVLAAVPLSIRVLP